MKLPSLSSLAAITLGVALVATLTTWAIERFQPPEPATAPQAVALAESLATARAEARHNLQAWKAALRDAPPDTVVRWATRYVRRHDTVWATVQDSLQVADPVEVVRWLVVSDSACRVSVDSLEGELVQARFDATQCAEEIAKRPTSCNGWSAFGAGFTAGAVLASGVCVGVR